MHAEQAYLFRHALLRDAAYQLQLPANRARLHMLALQIMESALRPRGTREVPAVFAAELAEHARAACDNPQLSRGERRMLLAREHRYLSRAANHARRSGDFTDAVALCERALAHPASGSRDKIELSLELAEIWQVSGAFQKAVAISEQLLRRLPTSQRVQRARALTAMGAALGDLGQPEQARAHLEEAARICERISDWERLAHCLSMLAVHQQVSGDAKGALRNFERVLKFGRKHRNHLLMRAAFCGQAVFLQRAGQSAQAEKMARSALELAERGDSAMRGRELNVLHMIFAATGRRQQARDCMQKALELHRRCGNRRGEALALGNMANVETGDGNLDLAEAHLRAAGAIHEETGARRSHAAVLAKLGVLAFTRDEFEQAAQYTRQALMLARETANMDIQKLALGNLGIIGLHVGAVEAAEHFYRETIDLARQAGDHVFALCTEGQLSIALLLRGKLDEARALVLNAAAQVSARQHAVWRLSDILPALIRVFCAGWVRSGSNPQRAEELAQAQAALAEMGTLIRDAGQANDPDTKTRWVSCEDLVNEAANAMAQNRAPLIFRGHAPIDMDVMCRAAALNALTLDARERMRRENPLLFAAMSEGTANIVVPEWARQLETLR